MKLTIKKNLWSGILTVVFSAVLWFALPFCIKSKVSTLTSAVGPDYLPRLIIILMAICGVGLILYSLVLKKDETVEVVLKEEARTFLYIFALLAYVLLMPLLGFLISTLVFSCFSLFFLETKKPSHYAVIIILVIGIFVGFKYGLKVPLPTIWL
ncbi:MAG: tripartite tricarboxylate transporter TctB family protein [Lawsonibacter sp.]|jgi:phosphate/sulfate permease